MKLKEGFKAVKIGKDSFIVNVCTDTVDLRTAIYLNPTAQVLFGALAEECSEEELTELLLGTYDVSREQAEQDIRAFITNLREKDMLN